jgi:polysaccharide pyruvyl transferase WcaK-like protein
LALRHATAIVPRDDGASVRELRRLAVPRRLVQVGVDPAVTIEPASPAAVLDRLALTGPYAVIAAHGEVAAALPHLRAAVEHLNARGIATLFVPMVVEGEHDDRILARELPGVRVLEELPDEEVLMGVVGGAQVAIGTRYHLAVFAAARGVPAIGLHSDTYGRRKMRGLAAQSGEVVSALPVTASPAEVTRRLERLPPASGLSRLSGLRPIPGVEMALRAMGAL